MKKLTTAALLTCCFSSILFAQKKNEGYRYAIRHTVSPIEINGELEEETWQTAAVATDFFMVLPMDTSRAELRTEVRMAYDERFVYISAVNFQSHPVRIESLRRDWNFGKNDTLFFSWIPSGQHE